MNRMINNNNFIGTIPLTINALTLPKLSILFALFLFIYYLFIYLFYYEFKE